MDFPFMTSAAPESAQSTKWTALTATAGVLARWSLGLLFIQMGLSKALHPVEFLKLVRQYEMVTNPYLLTFIAASLPWFEVFCGMLLALGIAVRGAAFMSLVMLIPFTALVFQRAWGIHAASGQPFCAIRFDCGCGNGEVLICHKLIENSLLMLVSAALLVLRQHRLCLWAKLVGPRAPQAPGAGIP